MVIDTGPPSKSEQTFSDCIFEHQPLWDRQVELLVLTHMDSDHTGGTVELLNQFQVNEALFLPVGKDTSGFWELRDALLEKKQQKKLAFVVPQAGDIWVSRGILAQPDLKLTVLSPSREDWKQLLTEFDSPETTLSAFYSSLTEHTQNQNELSIVLLLEYGQFRMALMGDAPATTELALVEERMIQQIDVLKAGHHGSKTSSHLSFLQATRPEHTLISVGKGNSYSHPSPEVIKNLEQIESEIWRTDQVGEVVVESNGKTYQVGGREKRKISLPMVKSRLLAFFSNTF